ncbi:MAG TPA: phosphoenolpyruvate-utilizing N-terminal domain-containing protein, partial [Thermodesulfobacteriota bacterium]
MSGSVNPTERTRSREPIRFVGVGGSPGVALGRAHVLDRRDLDILEYDIDPEQVAEERARLAAAFAESRRQLAELREGLSREALGDHVHILDSHILMLEDSSLVGAAERLVAEERINAEWAVRRAFATLRAQFEKIPDEYIRSRAQDLAYIEERVLRNLMGQPRERVTGLQGPVVVVAHDVAPSEIVALKRAGVLAVVTETGGPATHTAIMARSL